MTRTRQVKWHDGRRANIRRSHPEVRELYGYDATTQLAIVGVVGAQFAVAGLLSKTGLLPWLGATLTIGPTLAHAIGVLIHETSHNLVAKGTFRNKVWSLILNLPLGAPAAISFRHQHLLHHRHLGDIDEGDTQAPSPSEDEWAGSSRIRKFLALTMRLVLWKPKNRKKPPRDAWLIANFITTLAATALVLLYLGILPALYLLISPLLAFGSHLFGARRLSEHYPIVAGQPSNSYYGILNKISFNVGYHVEHHDFPNIPWTKMEKLKRLAIDAYEPLFSFPSWTQLISSYVLDSRYRASHYLGMTEPLGIDFISPKTAKLPDRRETRSKSGFYTPDRGSSSWQAKPPGRKSA